MQPKERIIYQERPGILWEFTETNMFSLYNKLYFCTIDYYSTFLVIKQTESLSENSLILASKVISQNIAYKKE